MYPFMVLDVPHDADDDTIRARYEELSAQYPPGEYPEMHRLIEHAYREIADANGRIDTRLLHLGARDTTLTQDLPTWLTHRPRQRMTFTQLQDFLRAIPDD